MTRNRLLALVTWLPVILLLLGLLVFALGMGLQYLLNRKLTMTLTGSEASPFVPIAMSGLCLAALALLIWLVGIGVLLGRH
jgi:hypothetical protein